MAIVRILIFIGLIAILISLGSALYHLYVGRQDSQKLLRALTVRIVLSLALFALIMIAWWAGALSPHGIGRIQPASVPPAQQVRPSH